MAKDNNIQDFLTDVADAIREKKGTTDLINPQDFSSEIANFKGGGVDFAVLGYGNDEISQIQADIDYSLELKQKWESGEIKTFHGYKQIIFAPVIDVSDKSDLSNLYNGCVNLKYIPLLNTSNATSMEYTFCKTSIEFMYSLNVENVLSLRECFSYNTSLLYVGELYSSKCENFRSMFYWDSSLLKIELLDVGSATNFQNPFNTCTALNFLKVINIGKSSLTTFNFSGVSYWGTGGEENRQSLIDSLITYSYDRASAGMATATIQLSGNTKALLTEEEIAQITAKGFTIS